MKKAMVSLLGIACLFMNILSASTHVSNDRSKDITMKAVVLEEFGSVDHLKLKEVAIPQPKKGEVRIRIKAAGFNPVDYKIREGMLGGVVPRIIGEDCSGIVDAVGPGVKNFTIGDEVYAMAYGPCSNGTYAAFVCVHAKLVAKKPKNLTFEQAAAIPLAAFTAYRAMIASGALKKGDRIFIAGAGGGVGCLAVQFAKTARVKEMFTVARDSESAQFLEKVLGFKKENILIYKGLSIEEMEKQLIAMNGGRLFDATADFVGGEMKTLCLQLTGFSGHFSTALPEEEFSISAWKGSDICFSRNMSLHIISVGAESFASTELFGIYKTHFAKISNLIEKGEIDPPSTHVVGKLNVESVKAAHQMLEEGRVKGKLVMSID